jgi:hypothetical protein
MNHTATIATIAAIAISSQASAADTQAAFAGLAVITAATPGCVNVGGTVPGNVHPTIYRPKILSTDTISYFSFISFESAITLGNTTESVNHQMRGAGAYAATAIDKRALPFTYNATYNFTVTPAAIIATTSPIEIVGTINSYFNVAGCNVSFTAAYTPVK